MNQFMEAMMYLFAFGCFITIVGAPFAMLIILGIEISNQLDRIGDKL